MVDKTGHWLLLWKLQGLIEFFCGLNLVTKMQSYLVFVVFYEASLFFNDPTEIYIRTNLTFAEFFCVWI